MSEDETLDVVALFTYRVDEYGLVSKRFMALLEACEDGLDSGYMIAVGL